MRGDDRRHVHRERGGGGEIRARGVAHAHAVIARVNWARRGDGVSLIRRVREVGGFKLPLVREGRAARGAHEERRVARGDDRLWRGIKEDLRREQHRENRGIAGVGPGGIAREHAVVARVGGLTIGDRERRRVRAGNVRVLELPLKIRRGRAHRRRGERRGRAENHRLVRRLRRDERTGDHCERRDAAGDGAAEIAHERAVRSGIGELHIRE